MTEMNDPVGPDEAELPGEPLDPEEIDPFEADPQEYDDVNEFVREEWEASTSGRERVEKIVRRCRSPLTVSEIAEKAGVSDPTARKELKRLTERGVITAEPSDRGTVYQRDPDWQRLQRINRLADEPRPELESALRNLESELEGFRKQYGVESPEELILDRDRDLDGDAWDDVSHWRTAAIDIEYIRVALGLKTVSATEKKQGTGGRFTPPSGDEDDRRPPTDGRDANVAR